jgi:hypothetical protein|tara:strand:+ start:45 stop:176 length:132 start_codon:yes stop_codon:yes gene_type:complete
MPSLGLNFSFATALQEAIATVTRFWENKVDLWEAQGDVWEQQT